MNIRLNTRARGLLSARLDAGAATKILNELQKTFDEFKTERDKEMSDIKKNLADVVQTEKVDRINGEITVLNKALDEVNASLAAIKIGGHGDPANPDVKAHSDAFGRYFRKGVDADLREFEVKAKLTTESDPDGGYLVPEETEDAITRVLGTVSTMRSLSRVMQVSTDTYKKLVSQGGTGSGWVGESDSRPETSGPTLREISINCHELYAMPASTQRALDDARIDIASWLAEEVSTEFAEQEGLAFISGDGVNKPRGLLAYPTVANSSYAWGSLGFVVSGAAAGFAASSPADALIDLFYGLKAGYRNNATWLTSDAVMGSIRKFKDGQGNYLWQPPQGADTVATILGKPVATDDNMPALGANAFPVAFGDFNRSYMLLDRMGTRVLRDPFTSKPNVLFYTTKRVGGGLINFEAMKLLKCST
ncbi:MAG: phage major capsid protein [Rhizobiales bacterium]|nr:phage major capsid protein [Hyphomicrobiales bacterium]